MTLDGLVGDPDIPLEQELAHWEQLVFSFDMQDDQNPRRTPDGVDTDSQRQEQTDLQTAAFLAALSSDSPSMYSSQYGDSRGTLSVDTQNLLLPNTNISSLLGSHPTYWAPPMSGNAPAYPATPQRPVASASSSTSSPTLDAVDEEYDDKRRRNTAASARFRIKKKQRALDLERTVSDLNGRAEDLEREVADLRRENGWLKEIVILKGGQFSGVDLSRPLGFPGSSERTDQRAARAEIVESSDGDGSQDDKRRGSKGKGKTKAGSKSK